MNKNNNGHDATVGGWIKYTYPYSKDVVYFRACHVKALHENRWIHDNRKYTVIDYGEVSAKSPSRPPQIEHPPDMIWGAVRKALLAQPDDVIDLNAHLIEEAAKS